MSLGGDKSLISTQCEDIALSLVVTRVVPEGNQVTPDQLRPASSKEDLIKFLLVKDIR